MPAYRDIIKTYEEFQKFISFAHIPVKVVLFTNKNQTTSLYKAVTAEFKGRIKFGEVNDAASPEILEKEGIT